MVRRTITALVGVGICIGGVALPALAYSPYLDQVRALYAAPYSCVLCHDREHHLNAFGQNFDKALQAQRDPYLALEALAQQDSDGDGVTDRDELIAGTLPQDRFSRPGGVATQPAAPTGQ